MRADHAAVLDAHVQAAQKQFNERPSMPRTEAQQIRARMQTMLAALVPINHPCACNGR